MSSASAPALPPEIGPGEEFTRFILSKEHFAASKGRVKPAALMPAFNPDSNRWETSTQRVALLTEAEIWQLGYHTVENIAEGRTVKARGIGAFSLVTAQRLSPDVNGPPYPRHVDLVGWPPDKHVRLMQATEIANRLRLEIDPRGQR